MLAFTLLFVKKKNGFRDINPMNTINTSSHKKRILLLTHYFHNHVGGVETIAFNIAKDLAAKYKITWVASKVDSFNLKDSNEITFISVPCLNLLEQYFGIPFPLWNPFFFPKVFSLVKENDIVHIHDFIYLGNMIAFIYAKLLKKPILITQHIGLVPYKNPLLKSLLNLINKTIGLYMLSHSDATVFYSKEVKAYFTKNKVFKNHIFFIQNGIDIKLFSSCSTEEKLIKRKKLGLKQDDIIFLFVGRFVEKKGLDKIKELANIFSNITWVLVGEGNINPKLWKLKNVIIFSKVSRETITDFYKASDLLVLPSKGEGLPVVIQEAMACGLPAITNKEIIDAYPEIKGMIYTAENSDIDSWEKELNKILESSNKVKSSNLINFAKEHWDAEKCADEYHNLFKTL